MSLHVIETGEIVEPLTKIEAERLTARIADKLDDIADSLEQVVPLIGEALTREAWSALGYASPTAYVSERFAAAFQRLPIEVRRPLVAVLSEAGMSTRAIAPVMGTSRMAVQRDLDSGVTVRDTSTADAVTIPELPKADKITGMDGKQYARPEPMEPSKPKRRPITDQASDAGWEIRKATEKLQRIFEDDRLGRNKEEVATHLRGHLMYAVETLQGFLDTINDK